MSLQILARASKIFTKVNFSRWEKVSRMSNPSLLTTNLALYIDDKFENYIKSIKIIK